MHVGTGGANYETIDNSVQRDIVTEMPTIFSSSLKGALREFFKNKWGKNDDKLNYIFGPDNTRTVGKDGNIGHYNFLAADLISYPVRSEQKPYFNATSPFLLQQVNKLAKAFSLENVFPEITTAEENKPKTAAAGQTLEDWTSVGGLVLQDANIGENIAVFHEKDFKHLARKLPVIARNRLDNGESKNLWYEEVVPRESRFVFFVSMPDKDNYLTEFEKELNNGIVQIGANGSIGYGFCKITKIK